MSLKPTYRSDTKEQHGGNYSGAVTGGASDGVEEGTCQDEVEVKGGSHNDVQEDAGRDLDPAKEDDRNRGRDLDLTTEVSQQFGDASILKEESRAPLELEYRRDLPRGAWAKMLEEEPGRYLSLVKGDDRNIGRGLDLTTEVSQQFGDASILQSKNMVSTTDLLGGLSPDNSASPILQQEQAVEDETDGGELRSDREGISARDLQQQLVLVDSQDVPFMPEEVVLILFKFLKPRDILKASQTCQLWRSLGENDKLWQQKCKEVGLAYSLSPANKKALERRNENTSIAYSAWKENFLKIITIEMSHGVNKMEFFNDKIVTTFGTNLYVYCALSGKLLHKLVGHTGYVAGFQMNDLFIVSGSHDGSVKVWDVDTGSCLHTLFGHTAGVTFLPGMHGTIAVSGSFDTNTLRVWDLQEGRCRRTITVKPDWVRRHYDRMRAHYDRMRAHYGRVYEDNERVRHVQFDGRFVVSGSDDNTIKIWDPETGERLRTLYHNSYIQCLKFNGVDVVAGYDDGSIKVWDVNTGVLRHTLRVNCSQYMELQGDTLVCACDDRTAKIWNMSTGACLHTLGALNEHRRAISGIGVNDKLVVTSSRDGTVKLWDIKTGKFIRDMLVLESGGKRGEDEDGGCQDCVCCQVQ